MEKEGLKKVWEGKCSLLLLAGGDGRRLGYQNPKGMYPLKLNNVKSFFELFVTRIKSLTN